MAARFLLLMLCLVAIVFGSQATAQSAAERQELREIVNVTISPRRCNSRKAIAVSFRNLISHQDDYIGKCIKINGYYADRALFLHYADIESEYPASNPKFASRRIGILAKDEFLDELGEDTPDDRIEIFGLFTTCEEIAAALGGYFMGSYCHNTRGPIILVASYSR